MAKNVKLEPIEEPSIPPKEEEPKELIRLSKNEGIYLMNQITDICTAFQASINLPETTEINRDPPFYVKEILRALEEFNIIVR